jgi:hypothetical protein
MITRTAGTTDLTTAVYNLASRGIIKSPDFWIQNAVAGKTVAGVSAKALITNIAYYK